MPEQDKQVDLFIDSGAFSAWKQSSEIQVEDYIQFIKEYQDVIDIYANLDVIGDPIRTWKNQRKMEKAGLEPLPVFHYGNDLYWLKWYLNYGYPYISLGGMVPVSTNDLITWLDDLFLNHLTDSDGYPVIKVHGFGLTGLRLMLRYPWFSVDSTSWVITGRMGSVYVPRMSNGKWIYDVNSWKVAVSSKSPTTKEAGKHITTLPPRERKVILEYINEKGYKLGESRFVDVDKNYEPKEGEKWAGKKPPENETKRTLEVIDEPGISNQYQQRDEMNIIYFLDLESRMPEWPWPFKNGRKQKKLL